MISSEPDEHGGSAHALTYARRYALFVLVGIAGENDLDAADLAAEPNTTRRRHVRAITRPSKLRQQGNGQHRGKLHPRATAVGKRSRGPGEALRDHNEQRAEEPPAARHAARCGLPRPGPLEHAQNLAQIDPDVLLLRDLTHYRETHLAPVAAILIRRKTP
jgi:hypothetical protein